MTLPAKRAESPKGEINMALPIIIFGILLLIALALFLFGASRESMNAGFGFILLSAILIIISGMFVWSGGLQLTQVATANTVGDVTTYTYVEAQANYGSALWVISNIFVYGGIALTLLAFVLTVRQRRATSYEQQVANY